MQIQKLYLIRVLHITFWSVDLSLDSAIVGPGETFILVGITISTLKIKFIEQRSDSIVENRPHNIYQRTSPSVMRLRKKGFFVCTELSG